METHERRQLRSRVKWTIGLVLCAGWTVFWLYVALGLFFVTRGMAVEFSEEGALVVGLVAAILPLLFAGLGAILARLTLKRLRRLSKPDARGFEPIIPPRNEDATTNVE